MVDWDKTEAEMEKRLTVLERIAELELREIEYEQIIADVKAREKALREAVQKIINMGLTFDQLEIALAALEGDYGN